MIGPERYDAFAAHLTLNPHRALFDYWRSKFPEKGLPGRQHLDPVEIPSLLSMLYLVDVVWFGESLRFRYRLLGTDITGRAGRDMTGRWLDEVFPESATYARIKQVYLDIIETLQPHLGLFNILSPGREHIRANRIVLPLASDGSSVDMLLGMWVYDDAASQPPRGHPVTSL